MRVGVRASDPIFVASISVVELTYLVEKAWLAAYWSLNALRTALADASFALAPVSLDLRIAGVLQQIRREDVSDLPDRVIAATALALELPLVTRDRKIQAAAIQTIW